MRSSSAMLLVVVATGLASAEEVATQGRTTVGSSAMGFSAPEAAVVAPALGDYTERVLFDEAWRRPGLAPRDRSLVTNGALIAGGKAAQLVGRLNRGLDNGLAKAGISAVITHLAFYAGWPNAMSAASVSKAVFEKRPG